MPQGTGNSGQGMESKRVIDFSEMRAKRLDEKRRKTKRIFFKQLLSVYSVMGQSQMKAIEIVDVSEDGISFQVPYDTAQDWPKDADEMPLRLYFSQDTYLEIHVKVQNCRPAIDRNASYMRFGCSIDQKLGSYSAYQQFVRFLETYAEHAHKDLGDVTVFYL